MNDIPTSDKTEPVILRIGFGGGCHWCTEAVFASLNGVMRVEQGWIASVPPDEKPSEAVIAHFDPALIPLDILIEIHLRTHSSQSNHTMRGKYRSAVYSFDEEQKLQAEKILSRLTQDFNPPPVTRVLPFADFTSSPPRYQGYFRKNAEGPFCRNYIDPKLALLRKAFSAHARG